MGARASDVESPVRPEAPAVTTASSLAEASDAELAAALCGGDSDALDEAFRRHATLVARTIRRTAPASYIDDVVQIVFLTLWRAPERFRPERGSLAAYLVILARGKSIDTVRSQQARHDREDRFQQVSGDDVEDLALASVTADQLQAALRLLPMTERVAIELAYFGGDSYRVVAAKLGNAEGTTKSRIRTGLRHLEAALREMGVAEFG